MGKDGMLLAMLVKELGLNQICFTVDGSYDTKRFAAHKSSTETLYKQEGIKGEWIHTDFVKNLSVLKKCVARMIMGIPLLVHYRSNTLLQAYNIGESTCDINTKIPVRPLTGYFYSGNISKTLGIVSDGVQNGVSLMGSQKILIERYPHVPQFQKSCGHSANWCGQCPKCWGTPLLATAAGHKPKKYGMPALANESMSIPYWTARGNIMEAQSYIECVNKVNGKAYPKWLDGLNEVAQSLSWESEKLGKIFREHLKSYTEDPGPTGFGGIVDPSNWKERLDKGWR